MLVMMHAWIPKTYQSTFQPLMEGIVEDISSLECEQLAATIYECKDVFSSGPEDMGQTYLVTHTIDPYASHPDDFPSLNNMWKKLKSRKCWTEAISSHARAAR